MITNRGLAHLRAGGSGQPAQTPGQRAGSANSTPQQPLADTAVPRIVREPVTRVLRHAAAGRLGASAPVTSTACDHVPRRMMRP